MSTPPPSTFASLLRRSKFASHDPHIAQVYTTSKSHAHRGDWGVKRPLVAKRGHITIQNVDTIYQQTEWTNVATTAQFMRTFPEMSRPLTRVQGSWAKNLNSLDANRDWTVDSDFVKKPAIAVNPNVLDNGSAGPIMTQVDMGSRRSRPANENILRPASVRNPHAMSPRQFKSYIKKMQDESSTFTKFLEEKQLSTEKKLTVAYEVTDQHQRYMSRKSEEEILKPTSTELRPNPHFYGGLTYSHPSELELFYTSPTLPGRIVDREKFNDLLVAVGGFVGTVNSSKADGLGATDMGSENGVRTDRQGGSGVFRSEKISITHAPRVVGPKPEGLSDGQLNIVFRGCKTLMQSRQNPHRPGSREYIAWLDHDFARSENSMTKKYTPPVRTAQTEEEQKSNLLSTLKTMRGRKHPNSPSRSVIP